MFNLTSKYHFVFDDMQINLLLMLIEEYVNGAELQVCRIERARRVSQKTLFSTRGLRNINWTTYRKQHVTIFCDAHFYFICIGQVNKCFRRLCEKLQNRNLKEIYSEFKITFSQEIRNDLEHIDARAVGLKRIDGKDIAIGHIQDFKNFSNDNLTFNGKAYPVNKEALMKLKDLYLKIISVIHKDYALKDDKFVYNMANEKRLKRIVRIAQKEFQNYLHSKQIKGEIEI